jgi:hypothetical protein
MRALDDILFGFLIFFSMDRLVRLFSGTVIQGLAEKHTSDKSKIESWKLFAELVLLMFGIWLVFRFRSKLALFNKR